MKRREMLLLCALAMSVALAPAACLACDTALLVIDVQNEYVRVLNLTTIDGIQLVDRLVQVIGCARSAGVPVIYIQQRDSRFPVTSWEVAIAEAVAPHEGDPVVWKPYPDAFRATELLSVLQGLGIPRLLICGLSTSGCVDATVFGAVQHGFETWVLADAHSGAGSLDALNYYNATWPAVGATVVRSDAVDYGGFGCATATSP